MFPKFISKGALLSNSERQLEGEEGHEFSNQVEFRFSSESYGITRPLFGLVS